MVPADAHRAEGPDRRGGVVVRVWDGALLGTDRSARASDLRPLLGERVLPGQLLVVGRRQSTGHPRRESDAGVVRLALDQEERPRTSRRHVELDLTGDRPLTRVLPTVKSPALARLWGLLTWEEEPAGAQRPLPPGRPLALLLPGTPAYVLSFEYAGPAAGSAPEGPAGDDLPDRSGTRGPGATETELADDEPPFELRLSEIEALVRIFRPALRWPPGPSDDTTPPWTALPYEEALRAAYRRIERSALEALGLPKGRAPNPALLARLVSSGYLTYEHVSRVADACNLALAPRRLV